MLKIFLCFIIFTQSTLLWGQEEDVDHLELARLLIRDGNYARGERALKKLNSDDQDEKAQASFLWSLVYLSRGQHEEALNKINLSIKQGLQDKEIYLYQAEAYFQLEQFSQAKVALEKTDQETQSKLPFFLLSADILWGMGEQNQAWQILKQAQSRGFDEIVIKKKKFSYFMKAGLYQAAYDLASEYLSQRQLRGEALVMASQLRQAGQSRLALLLLQSLKVLQPGNERVALEMAQVYMNDKEVYSAALVMEEAAKHNSSLAYEAGELLRQVGKSYRARLLNMSVVDQEKSLKQKLALFLEDDDYQSLKFLLPQLRKHQLLENQKIRYAVSYAHFRTGDFGKARRLMTPISEPDLFEKTVELKREMQKCQDEGWSCVDTI